jgi:PAS domain S-box-containing protein
MRKKPIKRRTFVKVRANSAIESQLLDANQRLRSILFANEVGTWTWDVVNDRVIADENLARLFDLSPKDAAGAPIEKYLQSMHPDDRPAVVTAVANAIEDSSGKFEIDYRVVRNNGTTSWITARGKVERDAQGKPKYFPGVAIDVTERKLSEQKAEQLHHRLEQQSRLFHTTLSTIPDFAYIFDLDGRFVYANQALLDLWSLKLEEAVGKNFYDLQYPDELAERLQRQIQQVIATKTGLTDETPYTSPTGAGGCYEHILRPVLDRDGNVREVAGSTRDITEHKRAEEDLRHSQERYRILAESLETQVQERTLELEQRNNDVLSQAEQLRDLSVHLMEMQDEERRRIARELHDSAGQTIAMLMMNLGEIAKEAAAVNAGLSALAEESRKYAQELNQEIRTTSYLLHPPLLDETGLRAALEWYADGLKRRAGLEVEITIDTGLERPSRALELAIFRIAQECLTNIHRHSGSKTAHIRIARLEASLCVEVRDEGHGIAADKLSRIQKSGGGVGLRGMRERVRQFSGTVAIESRPGEGTKVSVMLPLEVSRSQRG